VVIYCIEDINDLKYVGSTKKKILNERLWEHRADKKRNKGVSSEKLNLYNCIIYELETCEKENKKERESYWINKIDCVNELKLNVDDAECKKNWRKNNPEYNKEYKLRLKHKNNI